MYVLLCRPARSKRKEGPGVQQSAVRAASKGRERDAGFESLMSRIAGRLDSLPRQLRSIAQLALDSPETFALGTAAELAQAAAVQPSALVRFATAFDFDGFAALRQVFRSHLVRRAPTYRERIQTLRRTSSAAAAGDVLRAQIDEAVTGLRHFSQTLDERTLHDTVDLLAKSSHVYLLAARRSFPVVSYLAYALAQLERRVTLLDGVGGMNSQIAAVLGPRDLLIVVSFRSYTPEVIDIARTSRGRGAAVVGITDSRASPLVPCSTLSLLLGDDRRSPFRSLVEPIVLAQSLVIALGHRLSEAPARRNGARR
jgi:DNA-binding MurR/RpiR family transcriptional regulator